MRRHTFGRRLGALTLEMYNLIRIYRSWRPIRLMIELEFQNHNILQYRNRNDFVNSINMLYSFLDERRFINYAYHQVAQAFGC